jgi:uncharacterized protein (DUF2147 family)
MIKRIFLFVCILITTNLFAQKESDIEGTWIPSSGKANVRIYKSGDHFYGAIIFLKEPIDSVTHKPKVDKNNPDKSKRNTPLMGYLLLKNFIFDDGIWKDGTIYDPENGKTYSCKITMKDKNTLDVRGFIGISLIGRTDVWKRKIK